MGEILLTRPFPRVNGHLLCGEFPLQDLAAEFGTPLYVYDLKWIRSRVALFRDAFPQVDPVIACSLKANGTLSFLRDL